MRGPFPADASPNPSDDSDFHLSDDEEFMANYRETRYRKFTEKVKTAKTLLEAQRDLEQRSEFKERFWNENVAELDRDNYVKHVEASGSGKLKNFDLKKTSS